MDADVPSPRMTLRWSASHHKSGKRAPPRRMWGSSSTGMIGSGRHRVTEPARPGSAELAHWPIAGAAAPPAPSGGPQRRRRHRPAKRLKQGDDPRAAPPVVYLTGQARRYRITASAVQDRHRASGSIMHFEIAGFGGFPHDANVIDEAVILSYVSVLFFDIVDQSAARASGSVSAPVAIVGMDRGQVWERSPLGPMDAGYHSVSRRGGSPPSPGRCARLLLPPALPGEGRSEGRLCAETLARLAQPPT
jgi:hypothetical protein